WPSFLSSRRVHTSFSRHWSSDVWSADLAALVDEVGQLQQGGVGPDVGALGCVEAGEEDEAGEGEDGRGEHPHGLETASADRTGFRTRGVGRIAQRTRISFGAAEALR